MLSSMQKLKLNIKYKTVYNKKSKVEKKMKSWVHFKIILIITVQIIYKYNFSKYLNLTNILFITD